MDIFKAISEAKSSVERNKKLYEDADTQGVAVITKCQTYETRKGEVLAFVDLMIKEATGKGEAPAPGSLRTVAFDPKDEFGIVRLRTFIVRVLGVDEKTVSKEDMHDTSIAVFKENAFVGFKVRYVVRPHTTKKGVLTSVVDFFHVPGQTPEVVDAERKALGV